MSSKEIPLKSGAAEDSGNPDSNLPRAVHEALSKYVTNWIKANKDEVNFPSKVFLLFFLYRLLSSLILSLRRTPLILLVMTSLVPG